MSKYYEYRDSKYIEKTDELLNVLPEFVKTFAIKLNIDNKAASTIYNYIDDIKRFFEYLLHTNPLLKGKTLKDIELDYLFSLTPMDIEEYFYEAGKFQKGSDARSLYKAKSPTWTKRNLASIRALYNYWYSHSGDLISNPALLVTGPKLKKKEVLTLDSDERNNLLDSAEMGAGLTERQIKFHNHKEYKTRDIAILVLMLSTGIRVGELVGLDIKDIDFKNGGIFVHRKGGKEMTVYFNDEAESYLKEYLDGFRLLESTKAKIDETDKDALFLSRYYKRIGVRDVERLVKKYKDAVAISEKITPHKLRGTFATQFYKQTKDIMALKEILGHEDIKTTQVYISNKDQIRRTKIRFD